LKAKEKLENDLKEVKRQLKKEKKNYLSKLYLDNNEENKEVADALQPVTYDFSDQTLTISTLDMNEIGGILNLSMGYNRFSLLSDNDEGMAVEEKQEELEEKSKEKNENEPVTDHSLKQIKKKQFRTLKKNKAYQRIEKMKQKNLSKKKSRKKINKKHAKSRSKKNKKFRKKFEK